MYQLYPDQERTLNLLRRKMGQGKRKVLLQAATGSGKTILATSLIQAADAKGKKTLFVLPRKELLKQTHQTYNNCGVIHGIIASGHKANGIHDHYIAMDKTLVRRLEDTRPPDVAFIDETHYGGQTIGNIIEWLDNNGSYIVGLTATPWLLSGKGLGCWYDDMVCGPGMRWLINNNRLSDYKLFTADVSRPGVKKTGGDYNAAALEKALFEDKARIGNAVKTYNQHCAGLRTVVFGVSIKDCERIADEFNTSGINAAVISGETPETERKNLIMQFAKGKLVLTNCELLTFGFDLAAQVGFDVTVEAMIDMAPTLSLAKQMQKWGRVLRIKENPAIICDHAGNVFEHDKPCAEREWTLEDRPKHGKGGEKSKETTITLRQCLACGYTFKPAPSCPKCGELVPVKERQIDEVDGTLVEVNIETFKKRQRQEVGKAESMDELWRIAKERGYASGWVFRQAKLKELV